MISRPWCRIDDTTADTLIQTVPVDEEMQDLGAFFKIFGDPTRLKILSLLEQKDLCVHDLSLLLDMSQTSISHQLKSLRQMRLVRYRKQGKMAIYSLCDNHIQSILHTGLEHIKELSQ